MERDVSPDEQPRNCTNARTRLARRWAFSSGRRPFGEPAEVRSAGVHRKRARVLAHPNAGRLGRDDPVRTDTSSPHKTTERNRHRTRTATDRPERTELPTITGPHPGYDPDGALDHWYFRCEGCGLESTDERLCEGCWRCGAECEEDNGSEREVGDDRG